MMMMIFNTKLMRRSASEIIRNLESRIARLEREASPSFSLLIKNHKARAGRYQNEYHGAYSKIFKILEEESLGFVETYWEESFKPVKGTNDWVLVINEEPQPNQLEKILRIRNVKLL